MENYEVKGVSQSSEIRKVYEDAVAQNIKFYRAISKSGICYGWDSEAINPITGVKGHHCRAKEGQEWFINDKYIEPVVEPIAEPVEEIAEEPTKTDDEIIDEAVEAIGEIIDKSDEPITETVVEPINETAAEEHEETEETKEPEETAEPEKNSEDEDKEEIDYKAMYEELLAEFNEYKSVVSAFFNLNK